MLATRQSVTLFSASYAVQCMKPATGKLLSFSKTLFLFTADDLISIIIPNIVCGTIIALSGVPFESLVPIRQILSNLPWACLWVWTSLLTFNLSNQRQLAAIKEDAVNKPWRPLPSQRLSGSQATVLNCALVPITILLSLFTGGLGPSVGLHILTLWYNDLGGGEHWLTRGLLNAGGYLCFILGTVQVSLGTNHLEYTDLALKWIGVVVTSVGTGIHAMDLYDQDGDKLRNRGTVPLVFGDLAARLSIAISVWGVTVVAPKIFESSFTSPSLGLAMVIIWRLMRKDLNTKASDKRTFKLWCLWIMSVYLMPLWNLSS